MQNVEKFVKIWRHFSTWSALIPCSSSIKLAIISWSRKFKVTWCWMRNNCEIIAWSSSLQFLDVLDDLKSVESFAGSSSWNIILVRFSRNIQLLDLNVDVKWMRTDPVFIMNWMIIGCKPYRYYKKIYQVQSTLNSCSRRLLQTG